MSTKTDVPARSAAARRAATQRAAREAASRAQRRKTIAWVAGSALAVVLIGIVLAALLSARDGADPGTAASATVGGDLHTISAIDGNLYLAGHSAAGVSADGGQSWQDIPSLTNADPMGWAVTSEAILVGGHPGLFRSSDGGKTFSPVPDAFADVHALGSAGDVVYAASAQSGVLASTDGGLTWEIRNATAGQSFMGTMLVDPEDAERVIAPDMAGGLVLSTDGGRSWSSIGGPMGAMAVTWNPANTSELLAVGMNGGSVSTDSGATWREIALPPGTTAVTYAEDGAIIYAGVLNGLQGTAYRSTDGGTTWSPIS